MRQERSNLHGTIGYFASDGTSTGRELFSVSSEIDGSSVLRAQCMMDDDALVRDCLLCLDPENHPLEAFVRTIEGGRMLGSGHYRFEPSRILADILPANGSPQRIERAEACRFFGTHSLVNDGWIVRALGGETRAELTVHANSVAANGGGLPGLHATRAVVEEHGTQRRQVVAGSFECRHVTVTYGDYPPIEMWLCEQLDVLAFMRWDHLDGHYELLSLSGS
jgi:hypothetical protein